MRVVVDTNIFISAALKDKSLPALALRIAGLRCTLLKSGPTEKQLLNVLNRPHLAALLSARSVFWFEELLRAAELVVISERVSACRDPTDDKFLELAVNGRADMILSGDADLLVLNPFRGIPIVTAAIFVQSLTP
jgi:putative PIN family toxin of toxin-antitoxin system